MLPDNPKEREVVNIIGSDTGIIICLRAEFNKLADNVKIQEGGDVAK